MQIEVASAPACHHLPVKPANLRGAFTVGSDGGAMRLPLVLSFPCTFFFGLAFTLAMSSAMAENTILNTWHDFLQHGNYKEVCRRH